MIDLESNAIKRIVKNRYSSIAKSQKGCCSSCNCGSDDSASIAQSIGYSNNEIESVPDANLGLGCGNPTALSEIKEGQVVLDLGSGAGFDAFLAAKLVGKSGKVIGVDMTEEMIRKAIANAKKYDYQNCEFRLGDIENLPIDDDSVDVIISNCVINLAPDKGKVFREAFRVLKSKGKLCVSDIVLLQELTDEQRTDEELIAGCVGNAILKKDYLKLIGDAGFKLKTTLEDKEISKRQYQGLPLESLKLVAYKE